MEMMNSSSNVSPSISKACKVVSLDELKEIIKDKKEGSIHVLVTGDCHIATRSVENQKIIDTLNRITDPSILKYTDSLIINGDLLDRRISLASDEASEYILFSLGLLDRCKTYGVSLDVLEGTPSHDNRQPAIMTLFDTYRLDKDKSPLRYIDRVTVVPLLQSHRSEYVKKYYGRELQALFVPDEVSTDSQVTWAIVNEVLQLKGIEGVEMSYLHGTFRYQEPLFTEKSHSEENYESITNSRIVVNHWHLPSAKGRIRAPGSIERLRHGEEETKGFYYCILEPSDGSVSVKEYFVYNETATIFKTIDVSDKTLADAFVLLDDVAVRYPGARIRLQLSRMDAIYPSLSEIKNRYKSIKVTEKILDDETLSEIDMDLIEIDSSYSIRPDNIHDLIQDKISDESKEVRNSVSELIGE